MQGKIRVMENIALEAMNQVFMFMLFPLLIQTSFVANIKFKDKVSNDFSYKNF